MTPSFDAATARRFAAIALANVVREFPNKLDHVLGDAADVRAPRALHPAFYGSYDWHSCVHMHWLLARVRRLHPGIAERAAIDRLFDVHLAPAPIAGELAYLNGPHARTFERTYGWAWLLKLADELLRSPDSSARRASDALAPLADAMVQRYVEYLPRAEYPLRYGMHANSAFGLAFALDYARRVGATTLATLCEGTARAWFLSDRDAPVAWEPSGADFFSPALIEADLMRRVLSPAEFARWLAAFLPGFAQRAPQTLFSPVNVRDRGDPQIVHLDGLNLSRAWCFAGIAATLPPDDSRTAIARDAARLHREAGMTGIGSGDYLGEHWLASFAGLALADDVEGAC